MRGRRVSSLEELSTDDTRAIRHINNSGVFEGIIILPKRWDSVIEKQAGYIEGLSTDSLKEIKELVKKYCVNYFRKGLRIINFFLYDVIAILLSWAARQVN